MDCGNLRNPSDNLLIMDCIIYSTLVVIRSGMLGDIHWWEVSLCRCAPTGSDCDVGEWAQTGQAKECCLLW